MMDPVLKGRFISGLFLGALVGVFLSLIFYAWTGKAFWFIFIIITALISGAQVLITPRPRRDEKE